jgi:hypothetical protein
VTNFDRAEELRKRRAAAAVAALFVQACQSGNVATFYQAVDQINLTLGGWKVAMRRFAGKVQPFQRGHEKSVFCFGGSAIVAFGEPGAWRPCDDIVKHTGDGVAHVTSRATRCSRIGLPNLRGSRRLYAELQSRRTATCSTMVSPSGVQVGVLLILPVK